MTILSWPSRYITVYPDGTPAALDMNSGGYPYKASTINEVKFWFTREEATKYASSFKELTVYQATPQLEVV